MFLDTPGYLVTIDFEKAFDSLDHDFLVLEKNLVLMKLHLLDKSIIK